LESAVVISYRSLLAGLVALSTALPAASASAQGLFDFLFGAPRRAQPPSAHSYADPNGTRSAERGAGAGSGVAFCVRLCDGRYFPIQRASGVNPAQVCGSSCPAAHTKVFSGGAIDYATADDGSRYKDQPTAFVYRDQTVADCTCNGKDPYGLVATDPHDDPTLRPGDIVATEQGFVAYSGGRRNGAFTPIDSYGGLSRELRHRLSDAKITPRHATPVPDESTGATTGRRVQADK
jgi:hypothetical protein